MVGQENLERTLAVFRKNIFCSRRKDALCKSGHIFSLLEATLNGKNWLPGYIENLLCGSKFFSYRVPP